MKHWTAPDGTRLDFTYDSGVLRSVISSRGYALLFPSAGTKWDKACAVNMATTYVTATSACPAGAQSVTFGYSTSPTHGGSLLTSVSDATGDATTYSYTGTGVDHLRCIKRPGQTTCQIENTYNVCHRDPTTQQDPPNMRLMDQVVSQVTATGETYSYSFPANPQCPDPDTGTTEVTMTTDSVATPTASVALTVHTNSAGLPVWINAPLDRETSATYYTPRPLLSEPTLPYRVTQPAGNSAEYQYDDRGNIIEARLKAKPPGTGETPLDDIVTTAKYPDTCDATNRKICNKPEYVIDAKLNRTDYTFAAAHGGLLTETGPAVGGVRPQKRFAYAQRSAWIKNSTGGYSKTKDPSGNNVPVWVLTQESFCKTGAANSTSTGCAIAGDEVVTTYDYGPDAGPNNLLPRGIVTDAGGLSLRTCYRYDAQGNKISETKPKANLTSCA